MEAQHLRTFLKIIELGSITRAADALNLAQPSLSQQLLKLEDEVGMKLFRRTTRGVTTTEAGRIFEEHARHILRSMDQAIEDVRQLKTEARGKVSFGIPASIGMVMGTTLVDAALKHAPSVSLLLTEAPSGFIRASLDQGNLDLGILFLATPLRHLSTKELAREELFLIGPEGHLSGVEAPPQSLERIGTLPMVLPSMEQGLRQVLDHDTQQLGLQLQVKLEIDSLPQLLNVVASGHGYSILPASAARTFAGQGRISIARIEGSALRRTVYLVRNPNRVVTRASVRIEDLAIKMMRQLIIKNRWQAEPGPALG